MTGAELTKDEIRTLLATWRQRYLAADAAGLADLYALDGLLAYVEEVSSSAGRDAIQARFESCFQDKGSVGELSFEWGEPAIEGGMAAVEFTDVRGSEAPNGVAIMAFAWGLIAFDRRFREPPQSGGE